MNLPPRTYLDWNASAPLAPEARAAMIAALDLAGNPSSVHGEGRAARRLVEDAREEVAGLVGAAPKDVIFTSGATEANNLVLAAPFDVLAVAATEHASVLEPARATVRGVVMLACGGDGVVAPAAAHRLDEDVAPGATALVSVGLANGETGVIQPVAQFAGSLRAGWRLHTDATQAVGRIAVSFEDLGVDYLTLSSHKLGGPKGAGALVVRDGAPLGGRMLGGGQERRRRAGTENVAAIAGFGAAARLARERLPSMAEVARRRDRLEAEVLGRGLGALIIGAGAPRLANTSCLAFPGRAAETLVAALDLAGIAVSAGSACSSGKVGPSHVLAAMALPPDVGQSAIRVSIGQDTTDADLDRFLAALDIITARSAARRAA